MCPYKRHRLVPGGEAAVDEGPREPTAAELEAAEEAKQMTLEEYEAVVAEKRAGLNQQRESAFKVCVRLWCVANSRLFP